MSESAVDSDGDGLSDRLEEAIGTNGAAWDSDHDGYSDKLEVRNGFDPLGPGAVPADANFVDSLKGRILIQVESHGEAWYVNPVDGKRYYMPDGFTAYRIMRFFGLGITNEDLYTIPERANAETMVTCPEADWNCFINNIQAEQRVEMGNTLALDDFLGFDVTTVSRYEHRPMNSAGRYTFINETVDQEVLVGGQVPEGALTAAGVIQTCTHADRVDVVAMLRRWQEGTMSVGIHYDSETDTTTQTGDQAFMTCSDNSAEILNQ